MQESLGRLTQGPAPLRGDDASGLRGCADMTALGPGRARSLLSPRSAPAPVVGAGLELALLGSD